MEGKVVCLLGMSIPKNEDTYHRMATLTPADDGLR